MSYTIINCEQRTPEWHEARRGRLTASVAGDMLATIKTGEAAARRNLRLRLALERITGKVMESDYVSAAMQAGIDREDAARRAYEAFAGELVETVGFVQHSTLMAGGSPDGVKLAQDGRIVKCLELKSPEPSAHYAYLKTGTMGAAYRAQVMHMLWLTGAESCDWMSYCPEFPEHLRLRLITVTRDEQEILDYERKALAFLGEVDLEVQSVNDCAVAF